MNASDVMNAKVPLDCNDGVMSKSVECLARQHLLARPAVQDDWERLGVHWKYPFQFARPVVEHSLVV